MRSYLRTLKGTLFAIDLCLFYVALLATLLLRYGQYHEVIWGNHFFAFSVLAVFWFTAFYLARLYEPEKWPHSRKFFEIFFRAISWNILIAIALFYLFPSFQISPKVNLVLFTVVYVVLVSWWRYQFNVYFFRRRRPIQLIVFGQGSGVGRLKKDIEAHPQLGFRFFGNYDPKQVNWDLIKEAVRREPTWLVVSHAVDLLPLGRAVFQRLGPQVPVTDILFFYETFFGLLPLEELHEYWVLKEIIELKNDVQKFFKRAFDLIGATVIGFLGALLAPFIILGIRLSSPGPLLFRQRRVGLNGRPFTIYKFRTMSNVEDNGDWAAESDPRVTPFGQWLRRTHLDEIPQVVNIIQGDLSIVGPRPEQVPIAEQLNREIQFYHLRHLVRPGITGWAQINFRYARSVDDSKHKLEYDLYYVKNQSILLDAAILLKTVMCVFRK